MLPGLGSGFVGSGSPGRSPARADCESEGGPKRQLRRGPPRGRPQSVVAGEPPTSARPDQPGRRCPPPRQDAAAAEALGGDLAHPAGGRAEPASTWCLMPWRRRRRPGGRGAAPEERRDPALRSQRVTSASALSLPPLEAGRWRKSPHTREVAGSNPAAPTRGSPATAEFLRGRGLRGLGRIRAQTRAVPMCAQKTPSTRARSAAFTSSPRRIARA
jgi:hypothetical protein